MLDPVQSSYINISRGEKLDMAEESAGLKSAI